MLEQRINDLENKLTWHSVIPLESVAKKSLLLNLCISQISCIPIGTAKIVLGIAQTIAALGLSILIIIPACGNRKYRDLLWRSFSHIPHGIGNIAAGAFEAVPIVGNISVFIRFCKTTYPISSSIMTEHDYMQLAAFKFYSYSSINYPSWQSLHQKQLDDVDKDFPNKWSLFGGKSDSLIRLENKISSELHLKKKEWEELTNKITFLDAFVWKNKHLYDLSLKAMQNQICSANVELILRTTNLPKKLVLEGQTEIDRLTNLKITVNNLNHALKQRMLLITSNRKLFQEFEREVGKLNNQK